MGTTCLAGAGINTGQIDLADESHLGRLIRIVRSTVDLERVYAILVRALPLCGVSDQRSCYRDREGRVI